MSVYLDHAATTPMFDVAIEAMNSSLRKLGNPSSLHTEGRSTRKDVEDARESIARAVGCQASEVIFTAISFLSLCHLYSVSPALDCLGALSIENLLTGYRSKNRAIATSPASLRIS